MEKVSNCCGARVDELNAENIGRCSECREVCGVEKIFTDEDYEQKFQEIKKDIGKFYQQRETFINEYQEWCNAFEKLKGEIDKFAEREEWFEVDAGDLSKLSEEKK